MNNVTKTLLAGAAIGALATAPAMAGNAPHFSVTAAHVGNQVIKSTIRTPSRQALTYNIYISSSVSGSVGTSTNLFQTYYKWNSNLSICTVPFMKLVGPKRTTYGKINHNTETYSLGCASGPTVFHGDNYTLKKASGDGQTDTFLSDLKGKFNNGSVKYKGNLFIHGTVHIG